MTLLVDQSWLPFLSVGISVLSLLVAGTSLGWNVYRDVILRPRVRVTFVVRRIAAIGSGKPPSPPYLAVEGTNFGPGRVKIMMVHAWQRGLWRRLTRRALKGVVPHDMNNGINPRFPLDLQVGDTVSVFFAAEHAGFLRDPFMTHVGFGDSFGRVHWARRKDVVDARRDFKTELDRGAA